MAYTDQERIENYLKRSLTAAEVAGLPILIAGVSEFINRYCGRDFEGLNTEEDRYYQFEGGNQLFIDDAEEVSEVAVLSKFSEDETLLTEETDFYVYPLNSIPKTSIYFGQHYHRSPKRFRVKAKWGTKNPPADIVLAATILAADSYNNPGNLKSESIEGYSRTWDNNTSGEIHPTAKRILDSRQEVLLG